MSEPLPEPVIYAEDQCGVRWPLFLLSIVVTTAAVLGFLLLVDLAVTLPPMWGLVFFALTPLMWVFHFVRTAWKGRQRTGIRIDSREIRIGGLQRFERLQREGRWPPRRRPTVKSQYSAVFSCQWQNVRDLYLITGRRELNAIVKQHRLPAGSPYARQLPLGFLPAPWIRAPSSSATGRWTVPWTRTTSQASGAPSG